MEILVIEDDPAIGAALTRGFRERGDECIWVKDGSRGLEQAQSLPFDAPVLDIMLPGTDGLTIVEELREKGVATPVILLTALGSVEERVSGLQSGADDYLVKPFAFDELVARVEAVRRRVVARPAMQMTCGEVSLDLATRRVVLRDREIDLTPTEFSLLEYLMRHAGHVVTRKMLCEHLWSADWEGTTNVIEVHINRLRSKLDRDGNESLIQTARGRGYAIRKILGADPVA
jgi:two-component system OmpR family response regulator/two-component system copper resistance phosphate regulon response regulator CusR